MLGIVQAIIPVLILIGLGYVLVVRELLQPSEVEGISKFVFMLALPALLFDNLANSELPHAISWLFFVAFYAVSYFTFAVAVFAGRKWFGMKSSDRAIFGLGSTYSNLVLIGLPIVSAALGEAAVVPLLALFSVQNLLLLPVTDIVASQGEGEATLLQRIGRSIKSVATNSITLSLLLGFIFNVSQVHLPYVIAEPIHVVGLAALPCALLVIGASFPKYQVIHPAPEVWLSVFLKLFIQPLFVGILLFYVFPIEPLWATVAVMAAGMPTAINTFVISEKMHAGQRLASASIWLTTLLTVVSQTGFLWFFGGRS